MDLRKTGFLTRIARLARDESGNILPLVAAGMVLTATMIGGGVDMSRSYMVKNRLQAACDAGALAGRRAVSTNGYDTAAKAQATSYFSVNFDENTQATHNTTFSSTSTDSGNRVNGTARTTLDLLVMKLFGFRTLTVTATCTATMGVGNSDVTMVLDNTGSMDSTLSGTTQTRIQALRAAMKNFYTTVQTATAGSNARIRYSFVPFSTTVNVGHLLYNLNPDYLVDTWAIQSRMPVYRTVTTQVFAGWDAPVYTANQAYSSVTTTADTKLNNTSYNSSNSCNNAKPANTAWADNGSSSTSTSTTTNGAGQQVVTTTVSQPQRRTTYSCKKSGSKYFVYYNYENRTYYTYSYATSDPIYNTVTSQVFDHWDYKQISYDTSVYKTFQPVPTLIGGSSTPSLVSSTWAGCIEERKTVSDPSFSYSTLLGMNPSDAFDLDIDSAPDSDPDTKWAPMWPELAYYRTRTVNGNTSMYDATVTTQGAKAASYCPRASTTLATMTQTSFNSYADSLIATGNTYHDIGMLWGARVSSPDGIFADIVNVKPTNGGSVSRHIIYMTDGEPAADNNVQQAYGVEYHDRRITDDGSSEDDTRHIARFRALCDAVKA
ncbi:MAG: pilus assembly protein TadG, partial [Proteobacteria bacterium]|nr:pilus assembly protein TadG [Pseudomonadota bacterium]